MNIKNQETKNLLDLIEGVVARHTAVIVDRMATKDDLKGFATKDDLKGLRGDMIAMGNRLEAKMDEKVDFLAQATARQFDLMHKTFATKDYLDEKLKSFATRDYLDEKLKDFAKKKDMERFVTKDDIRESLKAFATREDLREFKMETRVSLAKIDKKLDDNIGHLSDFLMNNHDKRIQKLEYKVSFAG
jgi:hypothetical protein